MATFIAIKEALSNLQKGEKLIISLRDDLTYDISVSKGSALSIKVGESSTSSSAGSPFAGKSKAKPVMDTVTGKVYKSKTACGNAFLSEVKDKVKPGQEGFAWYLLIKKYPGRFKEV